MGPTLAVAGDYFTIFSIVIVFHQTFQGLGLGSCLATRTWPRRKSWLTRILGGAYGLTTTIDFAVSLGASSNFAPGSPKTLITNAVFDAINTGILIYTCVVEIWFTRSCTTPKMRRNWIKVMLFACFCICVGAGLMALLGKWA
jgi:zinc transporter 1/2/3